MAGATPAEVTLAPLIEALTHEHEVQIHIAHDGPPAPAETTLCEVARALGLVSLIAFPIFIKHRLHGFLALGRLSSGPRWLEEDLALLRITAGVIRSALERETSEMLQRMLTEAINHTDEGIIITDTQPRIQYVNPAYEKISGYSAEEALGKNPKLVQSGLHSPEFYENLYQTISQGRVWRGRFLNRRKDGTVFEEASTISPVRKPNGEITNYVAVKRDVTDQVRLEARVRMAQKLESIGQLAAGIAHEINTPTQYIGDNVRFLRKSTDVLLGLLHSIITVCEQSEYPPAAPPEVDDTGGNDIQRMVHDSRLDYLAHEIPLAIQQSIEGIEQVTRIVKALREFSYPNDKLSKIPLDLNRALDNTLTVSRNEWKYVAEIERDYDPDLASYFCSPGDLNQAFLNLIVNAAHAIEDKVKSGAFEQGRLTITTRQLPEHAEIRIGDNGIGIPPELLEKIFDPFFTTKEVGRGTGQGLSITYAAIVEKHKGTIDVESRVGEGTTFVIKLPLLHPSPAPGDPQTPQSTTELSTISGVNR
jgi:PAS domain S-box-containing protein